MEFTVSDFFSKEVEAPGKHPPPKSEINRVNIPQVVDLNFIINIFPHFAKILMII